MAQATEMGLDPGVHGAAGAGLQKPLAVRRPEMLLFGASSVKSAVVPVLTQI